MSRRMCDFFTTILIAGLVYSGCLTPDLGPVTATAQNTTCSTRPLNDTSNACASTAFVINQISATGASLVVGSSVITGGTSAGLLYKFGGVLGNTSNIFTNGTSLSQGVATYPSPFNLYSSGGVLQLGVPNATRMQIVDGSAASPVTTDQPSFMVSRFETQASQTTSAASIYGISVGSATTTQQPTAIQAYAYQLGSGDACGVCVIAENHGTGNRAAISGFFYASAYTSNSSSEGLELETVNATAQNAPYFANLVGKQVFIGIDNNYDGSAGGNTGTAAMIVRALSGKWDVGIGFNRFNSISPTITADIQTDTDAVSILLANTGAHTNGIDLLGSGSTYSGSAFKSPGFSVSGLGVGSFGKVGGTTGTINMLGSTSGTAAIVAQAAAGSPTLTLPTGTGTFAISASLPIVASATTGNLTCPTCVTSSGGGAITGTAPITVSAAGAVSLDPAGVTYAKIQNLGALAVMGRSANSSGVGADIQATAASDAVLRENGSTIGFGTIATGGIANNAVTLAKLATQATNTVLANATSGTAVPTAFAVSSCSTAGSALIWTTNTGFGCNTSITANAVPAANLTGSTLASGVTASSLTSVGILTGLSVTGTSGITSSRADGGYQYILINTGANPKNYGFAISTADGSWQFNDNGAGAFRMGIGITGGVKIGAGSTAYHGDGTLDIASTYYANGTAGVTCGAGLSGTSRTTNGIVTTC